MSPNIVIAGVYSRPAEAGDPVPGDEYVVLVNMDDKPVSLARWSLTNLKSDGAHHYRYLFPRRVLADGWALSPGEMAIVHTRRGCSVRVGEGQYHLYQQRDVSVWGDDGDTACLCDPSGEVVVKYAVSGRRPDRLNHK